jgi:hypothetical protein
MIDTPIFILGSGRCGSTLLQRTLNSYADITIWGEHNGVLAEIADAFFALLDRNDPTWPNVLRPRDVKLETTLDLTALKSPEKWQALMNGFDEDDVVDHFRKLVKGLLTHPTMAASDLWGFKEIRYGRDDRVIEFLQCLFPRAHFVFLVRNGLDTVASKAATFYTRKGPKRKPGVSVRIARASIAWRKQYQTFWDWHLSGKLNSHWLIFEELVDSLDSLAPVVAELSKDIGPEQRRVLTMSEGRGAAKVAGALDERWNFLSYPQLVLAQWLLGDMNSALGYQTPESVRWIPRLRRVFTRRPDRAAKGSVTQ